MTGPAAATTVDFEYAVRRIDHPGAQRGGLSIDLTRVSYNPHPTQGCFKNKILINYGLATTLPLSLTALGRDFLVRNRLLTSLDVYARKTCADEEVAVRRYRPNYTFDPDTKLAQLKSVEMTGRRGTPEAYTPITIARYAYGSATTHDDATNTEMLVYEKTNSIAIPGMPPQAIAQTSIFPTPVATSAVGLATTMMLTDLTGDGRPDLVWNDGTDENRMWIAHNVSAGVGAGTAFEAAARIDNPPYAETPKNLEERAALNPRFSVGNQDQVWRQMIDWNGDGRLDFVDATISPDSWKIWLNMPGTTPGQPRWVGRLMPTAPLRALLRSRDHIVDDGLLPVSRQVSRPDVIHKTCFQYLPALQQWIPWVGPLVLPCTGIPGQEEVSAGPENTYVEWELKDMNGDGYPDFVFNSSPIGLFPTNHDPATIPPPGPVFPTSGDRHDRGPGRPRPLRLRRPRRRIHLLFPHQVDARPIRP